jgi:hypothetical protein
MVVVAVVVRVAAVVLLPTHLAVTVRVSSFY